MANAIALIDMIDVTKVSFVSDVSGSWIFCVERAIKLIWFTAYRFASSLPDGTFPCAFKMCQGERRLSLMRREDKLLSPAARLLLGALPYFRAWPGGDTWRGIRG
ncbi:hypothetical protein [Ktedonospora formicarum]|uniref:hypothetical protein n=1 Tax=Ktedonospora formicarum TaxID=2778364 RepID=UPI001F37FF3C|nr:hypothetical protein [Ktedonospora formicarum]